MMQPLIRILLILVLFISSTAFGFSNSPAHGCHSDSQDSLEAFADPDCCEETSQKSCQCPSHHSCCSSPIGILNRLDRVLVYEKIGSVEAIEHFYSIKPAPLLDGPFQPPRVG